MNKKTKGIEVIHLKSGKRYRSGIIIDGKRISRTFRSEKNAIAYRDNMKKEREQSKLFNSQYDDYISLDSLFEIFILSKSDRRKSTNKTYESAYFLHIQPRIGKKRIRDIKAEHLDAIKQYLIDDNKSPSTISKIITMMKAIFAFAHRRRYLKENTLLYYTKPKLDQNSYQYWKKDEIDFFLEKIKDDHYFNIIVFAFNTGLRVGELAALTWSCVNIISDKEGSLTFGKQRNQSGEITGVKGHLTRTIPLTQKAIFVIKSLTTDEDTDEFLFLNQKNKPIHPGNLSRHWKKLQKKVGVKKSIKFHAIRHSFATYLVTQDVPLHVIQQILGHKNSDTTKRYAHIQFKDLKRSMDLINF